MYEEFVWSFKTNLRDQFILHVGYVSATSKVICTSIMFVSVQVCQVININYTLVMNLCTHYAIYFDKLQLEITKEKMTKNDERKLKNTAASAFEQNNARFHVEQAGGQMLCTPRCESCAAVAAAVLEENSKNANTQQD